MKRPHILILADDLTGANDTAIQFKKWGLSALVITDIAHADALFFKGYDVVSVNSDSRGMSPADAYRIMHDAIKALEVARDGLFVYKKVDSMLRGNPGQELAAVMDALNIPLALVAPAFPANRSILEHGLLPSGVDAVRIFAKGSGRNTKNIPLETIRQGVPSVVEFIRSQSSKGTQVFVADAVDDTDLETIHAASTCLGKPHILAGSAGLANQLARTVSKEKTVPPALVVAGSKQKETAAQILALSQGFSIPVIRFNVSLVMEGKSDEAIQKAYDEAVELMQYHIPVCIIAVESMFNTEDKANKHCIEGDEASNAISGALGILTGKLFDNFRFSLLVSTGGDTSMRICQHLGISGMEPLKEISPGIPLARIVGGAYNGRFIITKSGRFGETDALLKIFKFIEIHNE